MKIAKPAADRARSFFRWSRAAVYRTLGACMVSSGSAMTLSSLMVVGAGGFGFMSASGGGWGAFLDAYIKESLVGGLVGFLAGLGALLAGAGVFFYNLGRKISSRSASEVLRRSSDRPVLYLRSFSEDALTAASSRITTLLNLPSFATQEEQLVEVLEHAGTVVAVGKPGEKLPELGAARLYVQGNESQWRVEVTALMQRANLIAIRAGATEGVLWEIEQAVSLERPHQLVLLIPFDAPHYRHFSSRAGHFFPQGLPDWPSTTESRDKVGGQNTTPLDIKSVVYFDSRWQGALNRLQPTKRSVGSSRPLKDPLTKALQPVYQKLAIHPRRTTARRRTAKRAVTVFELAAGLMLGVLIAFKISPALAPLAEKVNTLHIFSTTRADRITEGMPGPLGVAFRDEINRSEAVRTWIESAPNSELVKMELRVASGMPRLSDELLERRAELVGTILNALDTERCGALTRSLDGRLGPPDDMLQLIATHLGPHGVKQWAHISVKGLEADLTNVPVRRVTEDSFTRAVTEVLDLLSEQDSARMADDLQQYESLQNGEICWVARTYFQAGPRLSAPSRSALLRGPFGTEP